MLNPENYHSMLIERRDDGVAIVTLNRPKKLNAVDSVMHTELTRFSTDFANDDSLRALVITGAGRAFCAGGDFGPDDQVTENTDGKKLWRESRDIVDNMLSCEKPIIAAVNGYALGLGATVALLADVAVVGPSTQFADTHVNMGIGAGDGGQVIWPFLIGVNRAKYYLMSGDKIGGKEAVEMGLASFIVAEDDQLLPRAIEIASTLAAGAPLAVAASKLAINAYLRSISATIFPLAARAQEETMGSNDHQEAIAAFQEKRAPRFTGK
jgi:enoyl-CoA hydratase/carnithine racemase